MDFPSDICSPSNALDLLDSPVWSSDDVYDSSFVIKVDWTLHPHSLLSYLEHPQCEFLLQQSRLNICKTSYLLHIIPMIKSWAIYKYLMMAYSMYVKPLRDIMLLCV